MRPAQESALRSSGRRHPTREAFRVGRNVDCTFCAGTTVLEGAIAIAMGGRALRESGAGAVGDELAMRLTGW
jgi:hypothetical protein